MSKKSLFPNVPYGLNVTINFRAGRYSSAREHSFNSLEIQI